MSENSSNIITRRSFLTGSALVAAAAALGFKGLFGDYTDAFAQGEGDDTKTMLNLAATAETFAITNYYYALNNKKINFNDQQISQLKGALDSEVDHLKFLQANGGVSLATQFYVPNQVWTNLDTFTTVTEQGELIFIGAYLAAVRRFSEIGQPLLSATAGQIAGIEAEHRALIREMGGKRGNNLSLLQASYYNVSDAVPSLTPFLKGGPGFDGPATAPSFGAVNALVGKDGVAIVKTFAEGAVKATTPNPQNVPAAPSATAAATAAS